MLLLLLSERSLSSRMKLASSRLHLYILDYTSTRQVPLIVFKLKRRYSQMKSSRREANGERSYKVLLIEILSIENPAEAARKFPCFQLSGKISF